MYWILTITGFFILIFLYFKKSYDYWKKLGVKQYSLSKAFRRCIKMVFQTEPIIKTMEDLYNDFPNDRYVGLLNIIAPGLMIKDPHLLKDILIKDFGHFTDQMTFVPEDAEPLWEKNLLSLKGEKWKKMRAIVSPSFTSNKMKTMFDKISQCSQNFVRYFEEKNVPLLKLNINDAFSRLASDFIACAIFGVTCDSMRNPNNEFYVTGNDLSTLSGFVKSMKFILLIFTSKFSKRLGLRLFNQKSSDYFVNIVKQNIEYREKTGTVCPDMIQLLMEAKNHVVHGSETENLSDLDIAAQAMIVFFAGYENIANILSLMAFELSTNVDVQEKLLNEIDETDQACQGQLTYEALFNMKYLDMVVNETLRKWPPSLVTSRSCVKSYTIEPVRPEETPFVVENGMQILIPIIGIHRDPKYYPNPLKFDPERFNEENKRKRDPSTFLTFGIGPRSCVARRFALMEMKVAAFYLFKKFSITVIEETDIPIKFQKSQIQLAFADGFWLGLKAR